MHQEKGTQSPLPPTPDWSEFPGQVLDEEPASEISEREQQYWTVVGITNAPPPAPRRFFWQKEKPLPTKERPHWLAIFATEEEAWAFGWESLNSPLRPWDKKPPQRITLGRVMEMARRSGALGVRLLQYDHAAQCWITVKEWPAGVPLK